MSHTYTRRSHSEELAQPSRSTSQSQGMSNSAMMSGGTPSASAMGRSVSMPASLRQRMENSFGADFSGVKFFESQQVADNGADAVTLGGGNVGFAPGKLDFSSKQGQELIGHELAHVVSHARGEVTGHGFLGNASLEAQADRQGEMAAAGQSVYSGPVTPLSASTVASAEGPMQAKKNKDNNDIIKKAAVPDMNNYQSGKVQNNEEIMDQLHKGAAIRGINGPGYKNMMAPVLNPLQQARTDYIKNLQNNGLDFSKASKFDIYKAPALGATYYNADTVAASKNMMGMMGQYLQQENVQSAIKELYDAHNNNWDSRLKDKEDTPEERDAYMMKQFLSKGFGSIQNGIYSDRDNPDEFNFAYRGIMTNLGNAEGLRGRLDDENMPDELRDLVAAYEPVRQQFMDIMHGNQGGGAAAAPAAMGEKTSNQTFGYRSDEIGALAQGNDYDPAAENGDLIGMRKLYDKIKNPGANDSAEDISARKRFFAEQRAAQMDAEYRRQNPPTSPAPAAPKKKWYQFWK